MRDSYEVGERIREIYRLVSKAAPRVAKLFDSTCDDPVWLTSRIPDGDQQEAHGFNVTIACALDLIPRDKQRLAAIMFTNRCNLEVVQQVRREATDMDPQSETCWWLASSQERTCQSEIEFLDTIDWVMDLVMDSDERQKVARKEFGGWFNTNCLMDGVPLIRSEDDLLGAYLHGYNWAVVHQVNTFLVSTILPSLGVFEREFPFSDRRDDKGNTLSGKLGSGTLQRCKCSSFEELVAVVKMVRENLGPPKAL